ALAAVHPQRFERPIPAAHGRSGADALLAGLLGHPKQLPPIAWPLPYLASAERVLLAQLGGLDREPVIALLGDALGAYSPSQARRLLADLHAQSAGRRRLLLGTDSTRDPEHLRR